MTDVVDISVCIATFRRAAGLRRLLASLRPTCAAHEGRVEVIVVDNDAAQSAHDVIAAEQATFPALRYVAEPRRGISHARNRGVAAARGAWGASIDDADDAAPAVLQSSAAAAAGGDADAYFGPIEAVTEGTPPAWFDVSVFFAYPKNDDGSLVGAEHTRTGNAFVRRALLGDAPFDPAFGLTGGGDYELFARLYDAGATFRWCAGARTRDHLPAQRLRLPWLLQRAFRGGYTYTLVDRRRRPGWAADARRIGRALVALGVFGTWLPFSALRGWPALTHRLRRICIQAGHLWVYLGSPVEPYR